MAESEDWCASTVERGAPVRHSSLHDCAFCALCGGAVVTFAALIAIYIADVPLPVQIGLTNQRGPQPALQGALRPPPRAPPALS